VLTYPLSSCHTGPLWLLIPPKMKEPNGMGKFALLFGKLEYPQPNQLRWLRKSPSGRGGEEERWCPISSPLTLVIILGHLLNNKISCLHFTLLPRTTLIDIRCKSSSDCTRFEKLPFSGSLGACLSLTKHRHMSFFDSAVCKSFFDCIECKSFFDCTEWLSFSGTTDIYIKKLNTKENRHIKAMSKKNNFIRKKQWENPKTKKKNKYNNFLICFPHNSRLKTSQTKQHKKKKSIYCWKVNYTSHHGCRNK